MEWLDKGVYTWEAQHPPLARIASAIGPYLLGIRSQNQDRTQKSAGLFEGTKILYSGHHYDLTLAMSRLGILPFFWIACLVVYRWGARYFTRSIAAVAVGAFTFLPPVLAHAGLSTTDMALTAFLGAAFLTGLLWLDQPDTRRAALFGLCGGLAILSKFSSLVFFPASAAGALICYIAAKRPAPRDLLRELRLRGPTIGLAAIVCFLVIWAGYRFSFGPVSFASFPLPFPELYAGVHQVQQHNAGGHPDYLLGQRGSSGWWYYFPVVLGVKTPLAFLILLGVWLLLTLRGRIGFEGNWMPMAFSSGIVAVAMCSKINIGIRHILPVFIGLSLLAAVAACWIVQRAGRQRWQMAALVLLAAWFAGSSLLSHPDYLPYFNELAGDHPENILVDSDLDWGQDIKRLSVRLHEMDVHEFYLCTLLIADFETQHGIPRRLDRLDVINPPTGWVAIEFTYWKQTRMGLYDNYPHLTIWPDRVPATEKVGKSMLLWYFPPGTRTSARHLAPPLESESPGSSPGVRRP